MKTHGLSGTGWLVAAHCAAMAGFVQADDFMARNGVESSPPEAMAPVREVAVPQGAPTPAELIIRQGDTPLPGLPVTVLNNPFTNDLGQFGFVGAMNGGGGNEHFVWFDGGIVWRNGDAVGQVLSGGEGTMGISDDGGFIYSPSTDGEDSVWSQTGLLAAGGQVAPDFPDGAVITFNSRPTMSANGAAHWVAGINFSGGTTSQARALYTASDATPATMTAILRSGDLVNGFPVAASGIDFDYWVSDDANHYILALQLTTGSSANDTVIWVDGVVVAQESGATGDGDNWSGLDNVSINNDGDYLFSGDTDGDAASDEFIAYNGAIAVREGDTLDGVTLVTGAAVQSVSINDLGQAAHIWSQSGGDHLFFACDAADLAASARVLSAGDALDFDGDGLADATVTDLNASAVVGPGLDLAEDGRIAVNVDLDFGGGDEGIAIVALALPSCVDDVIFADGFELPPTR